MIYYRASYPGFLRTVVRMFDTQEQAESWATRLGVRKIVTIDQFSTLMNDTNERES